MSGYSPTPGSASKTARGRAKGIFFDRCGPICHSGYGLIPSCRQPILYVDLVTISKVAVFQCIGPAVHTGSRATGDEELTLPVFDGVVDFRVALDPSHRSHALRVCHDASSRDDSRLVGWSRRDDKLFEYLVHVNVFEELIEGLHRHLNRQWIGNGRSLFSGLSRCGNLLHIVVI